MPPFSISTSFRGYLQVVWGPLIDRFPHSRLGHRKHWVLGGQAAAALVSLLLLTVKDPVAELPLLTALFFTHSIFASIQDASVDALAIAITPEAERGRVNAFMRGGFLLGISLGATLTAFLLDEYGFRAAVRVQSSILIGFTVVTALLPVGHTYVKGAAEKGVPLRELFRRLGRAVFSPDSLRAFLVMALCYLSFSVYIRSLSFYFIRHLGWQDQELTVLQGGYGSLATLVVVFSGGYMADRLGAQRLQQMVMWVLGGYMLLFSLGAEWWSVRPYALGGLLFWSLADPIFSVAAFPVLMALSRPSIAGAQFTAYMAFINLCDVGGSFLSGWSLTHFSGPLVCGLAGGIVLAAAVIHRIQVTGRSGNQEIPDTLIT